MTDRLRREAIKTLRSTIEEAIGCVALVKLQGERQRAPGTSLLALETQGEFIPLRSPLQIGLRARLRAQLVPADGEYAIWYARIVAYQYALLDRDGREYLAYHWHPEGASHVTEPHVHLGPAARVSVPELAGAHLPTGAVSLVAVIRLAIEAFEARPLRSDWAAVLQRATRPLTAASF